MLHRNSQKRIYIDDATYFITTTTKNRVAFFKEKIFCDLLIEELKICKDIFKFYLYAFVILDNHLHLLLKPKTAKDLSKIMHFLKRNSSRNINRIIESDTPRPEGEDDHPRLQGGFQSIEQKIKIFQKQFLQKYNQNSKFFPPFQWQKSFLDHFIRNQKDFKNHLLYIHQNPEKHGITKNYEQYKYSSLNAEFQAWIDQS